MTTKTSYQDDFTLKWLNFLDFKFRGFTIVIAKIKLH